MGEPNGIEAASVEYNRPFSRVFGIQATRGAADEA